MSYQRSAISSQESIKACVGVLNAEDAEVRREGKNDPQITEISQVEGLGLAAGPAFRLDGRAAAVSSIHCLNLRNLRNLRIILLLLRPG